MWFVACLVGLDMTVHALEGFVANYGDTLEEPDRIRIRPFRTAALAGLRSARLLLTMFLASRLGDNAPPELK